MSIPGEWDLTGKKAIITADRRGWTPSLACALAEAGALVAVAGSAESDMADAVEAVHAQGGTAIAITTDLTDRVSVEAMVVRGRGRVLAAWIFWSTTRVPTLARGLRTRHRERVVHSDGFQREVDLPDLLLVRLSSRRLAGGCFVKAADES